MVCLTRVSVVKPPITYVYSVCFIVGGIFATIANLLVLVILWLPSHRTRSNKILASLALSDFLVGCIVFPITGYQLVNYAALNSCDVDFARVYFSVFLSCSSCLILGVISYDRMILMTQFQKYEKKSTKRLIIILTILSWLIPGVSPFIRWVGSLPYLILNMSILIGPFFILIFNYFYITNTVKKQEKVLKQQYLESIRMSQESLAGDTFASSEDISFKVTYRTQQKHIKVAKTVTILILTYFCCTIPIIFWIILNVANTIAPFISPYSHQNLYLFAMVALSWNSCFNPVIYFAKNPEIRKGVKKIFKIKEKNDSPCN